MANRVLKLGDSFCAGEITGDENLALVLHDVIVDKDGDKWAIGLDGEGLPYAIQEDMIDTIKEEIFVNLPKKGK